MVWTLDGPNMEFWESETKPTKIQREELQPIKEKKRLLLRRRKRIKSSYLMSFPPLLKKKKTMRLFLFLKSKI